MSETSGTNDYNVNEFKTAVHEWLRLEEDLASIAKVVREKRKRKQHLDQFISSYMSHENKEICNVGENSAIVLSTRKSTCSLKKEHIVGVLVEALRNEERAKELMQQMYALREVREKYVIKQTEI
jgi:hypothetical protein